MTILPWAGVRLLGFSQHSVAVKYATEHRCGVAVSGPGLSDAITGTDPLKDNLPLQVCCMLHSTCIWACLGSPSPGELFFGFEVSASPEYKQAPRSNGASIPTKAM